MMEAPISKRSPACHCSQSQTESGLYNYGLSPHQLARGVTRREGGSAVEARGGSVFSFNCILSLAFGFRLLSLESDWRAKVLLLVFHIFLGRNSFPFHIYIS